MDNRSRIFETFGRAVFLSHIIEDRLKMHIFDCAFFSVGCMAHYPLEKTRKASFENLIDYYRLAHHDQPDTEKIWRQLHLLRQIRNQLVHGFVLQIHCDLQHEEGREQIIAMLDRFCAHALRLAQAIGSKHEALIAEAPKRLKRVFEHPGHPSKEGVVAKSEIQRWIEEIEKDA